MTRLRTRPWRITALLTTLATAIALLTVSGTAAFALWETSTSLAGSSGTGALAIDDDVLAVGTWTRDGQTIDPAAVRLGAGETFTYTVQDVSVTAVGENLTATFQDLDGAVVPESLSDHVTLAVSSDPSPVRGADSADGHQSVTLVMTVTAGSDLPRQKQTIDLTALGVTLSNGRGWSDTATLDAGTLTTWSSTAVGGSVHLQFDLALDDDGTIGIYLRDPAPGTIIRWGVWGSSGEEQTVATDGLNSWTYSDTSTKRDVYIVGSVDGIGSPGQTTSEVGSLTYVANWTDDVGGTDASYAFQDAVHLTHVGSLPSTLTDTSYAFRNAGSAVNGDAPYLAAGNWDSSLVETMAHMFEGSHYNPGGQTFRLDTSRVTDMSFMFAGADRFSGIVDFSDTSRVTTMEGMFQGASAFTGQGWGDATHRVDVSKVTTMAHMFDGATSFNGDIRAWNTSSVTDMSAMFRGAQSFDRDLSGWPVAAVTAYGDFADRDTLPVELWPQFPGLAEAEAQPEKQAEQQPEEQQETAGAPEAETAVADGTSASEPAEQETTASEETTAPTISEDPLEETDDAH